MSLRDRITTDHPLVLVGCGNMGGAMARGWFEAGLASDAFYGVDPGIAGKDETGFPDGRVVDSVASLPEGLAPAIVVLAVKPQLMKTILPELGALDLAGTTVITVAAGTDLGLIQDLAPAAAHYVRAMPNTPAAVGKGITGLFAARTSIDEVGELVELLVSSVGEYVWLDDENSMNALTAVSGSGPAYVFHLTEALAGAAEAEGFSPEVANQLARATVIGAARLLEEDNASAGELRTRVTSPAGTTAAALDVLMESAALTSLVREAVRAARRRGEELSRL